MGISEHEYNGRGTWFSYFLEDFQQEVSEVVNIEWTGDHNLLNIISQDEGWELRQTLFTGTTDSDKEGVSNREIKDSNDSANVLHGIIKENKIHDWLGFIMFF